MPLAVEVRFKGTRKELFAWEGDPAALNVNDRVVVDVERGRDLGRVSALGELAEKKCSTGCSGCAVGEAPADASRRAVVRPASPDDLRAADELRRSEEDVRRKVIARVRQHNLTMKVSDAEWQWDRNKLTVYFTAEKRVDFRALVRDLAAQFRTRIELRQIGVRDEAARLSGVGRCGREYCCSTWLTELSPVNLGLAKDQHLSLNPQQISGGCGRLLCCLKYEHEFYVTSRKRFPKEGKTLLTAVGLERVVAVDIFRERVFLRTEDQTARIIPLVQLREEVERLGDAQPAPGARLRQSMAADLDAEPATAEPGAPVPEPEAPAAEPAPLPEGSPARRRRRRGRRGRGGGLGGTPTPES